MQKMLKIAGAIFKTKQNHVKRIWPLERPPSIYLGYELISKTSKLKLDGVSIDGPCLYPYKLISLFPVSAIQNQAITESQNAAHHSQRHIVIRTKPANQPTNQTNKQTNKFIRSGVYLWPLRSNLAHMLRWPSLFPIPSDVLIRCVVSELHIEKSSSHLN